MFRNLLLAPLILLIAHHALATDGESKPAADRRPTKIWNRTGPLGETPKYVTDAQVVRDARRRRSAIHLQRRVGKGVEEAG
jgi:hypothetical protein